MSNLILPPGVSGRRVAPNKYEYTLFPKTAVVQKSDLGAPMIRTSSSKVYKWKSFRYWAEGGRIQIVDDSNDEYTSCSIEEFGDRALALIQQASELTRMGIWSDERADLVRTIGDMKSVLYDAKEQGDPHDPVVMAYKLRQRGRKASVGYTAASARPYKNKHGGVMTGKVVGSRPTLRIHGE